MHTLTYAHAHTCHTHAQTEVKDDLVLLLVEWTLCKASRKSRAPADPLALHAGACMYVPVRTGRYWYVPVLNALYKILYQQISDILSFFPPK